MKGNFSRRQRGREAASYFLGFDGGGTKTECAVAGADGEALARDRAGPSNPLRVGPAEALKALQVAAAQALQAAHVRRRDVRGICAGLGGVGRLPMAQRMTALLEKAFPAARVQVLTDLELALEAAAGSGPGVVLVAGTGSAACGRNAAGQTARAGGRGWWIGDQGSAFDIGRQALAAAARAHDGLGPPTKLEALIPAHLGCADWEEMAERAAVSPDECFPQVFPLVVAGAETGDAVAGSLLADAAKALAALAGSVIRRLRLSQEAFVMAKSGGVFGKSKALDSEVDSLLAAAAPRARIQALADSPAVAAARLARRFAPEAAHARAR